MQGVRTRALDSRGRPISGLYVRDGVFIAGFNCPQTHRWRMQALVADTITEARKERESLLAGLREARIAAPTATFYDVFCEYQASRTLADRTQRHEQQLLDKHLLKIKTCRAQDVTTTDVARLLRGMRDSYSPWTCVAVYRILRGTFALAVRRGILTRDPMLGLAPSEIPKQKNQTKIAVLDGETMERLVAAGTSERWRAALVLAGYAGLRLGEIQEAFAGATSTSTRARSRCSGHSCRMAPRKHRRRLPGRARCPCFLRCGERSSRGRFAHRGRGRPTS